MLENILKNTHINNVSHDPQDLVKLIRFVSINGSNIYLEDNKEYLTKIPNNLKNNKDDKFISYNSNLLYYGRSGSGKSCNLYLLSTWAYYNKCI